MAIALIVRHLARTGKDTPADQFGDSVPRQDGATPMTATP
jgi:hypothetical protein